MSPTHIHTYKYAYTDFSNWKEDFEQTSTSQFVKGTGEKKGDQTSTTYYYCNRSGFFDTKGLGSRHSKFQGSSKINAHCTACITTTKQEYSDNICVYVCKTHYGHQCALGHTRLQHNQREAIAGKLAQGVQVQHILDTIRDTVGERLDRIHLISRKDINNIERAYGLQGCRRHDDDATSVGLWVREMQSKGTKSPVLVYKAQGIKSFNEHPTLHENDFMLAIQTPFQAEMLKSFGHNVICIDATHGTNGYDFSLITVLVIDEFGEGYPVAWCLSNRTDLTSLLILFKSIKQQVGVITPKWIMTDDAQQFYSAWVGIFGVGPHKLLCIWHVDRAWRGQLNSIKDRQLAQTIYHALRVLLEETDKTKFEELLTKTLQKLSEDPSTQYFLNYFRTYYLHRKEEWAISYRKASLINTNMYVESFHRVLKHLYLKGKTNKRVDKCIQMLMKFERDKVFDKDTIKQPPADSTITSHKPKSENAIVNKHTDIHFECNICGKTYNYKTNLTRHKKGEHPEESIGGISCREDTCNFTCRTLSQLRHHLEDKHGMSFENEFITFHNEQGIWCMLIMCVLAVDI